ncbi:alpha/beta hydrolase [Duganella sp. FT3S]|uniref:Alpha/beta hydrolase n=1 Tax=Rugamonas fusca TaxID=2758568 RepID=A0A7W2I5E4_9BURK|nr:alpha/beta fold hydrolase [Rugamonas fusca]MBA5604292.1 alpha/beta hydrolase [Rugamonas fusca]
MATALANGITIAYETQGDPHDPPVLLVMGLGMQLTSWPQDFVDGLVEQGYYVIRFDNRDSGLSSKLRQHGTPSMTLTWLKSLVRWPIKSPYTLHDMADDARGLLDFLGIPKAHVVGVSMGGMIGQIFAACHAERTLSLTSIMSSSGRRGLPGPTPVARKAIMRMPADPRDRDQVVEHMVQTLRTIGSPAYPTPEKLLRTKIHQALDRNTCPDGIARQMVAIVACGDRTPLLAAINCPAMVIHGAADPLVPLACGEDTAMAIPNASMHVIEGMGHDLPPQLIERLIALIDAHLHGKMELNDKLPSTRRAGSDTHY